MIPQYLNPLGFVDKPDETGATFILTNPKDSKTLEPGTPVTIWRYSRGLLALDKIQGEITRVGYTTAVFTITGRETDPRWPEDQEILREKTPVYPGTERLIRARYEPDAHPGQTAAIAEHARRCPTSATNIESQVQDQPET